MVIESTGKLVLSVLFVFFGWKIYGALIGAILGTGIALILSFVPLRNIILVNEKRYGDLDIYSYLKPTFLIMSSIIIFYSLDIIIARIVFDTEIAGAYAIASVLSKTIFWGTQPISRAMFPMSAERKVKNKGHSDIFGNSLLMLIIGIGIALSLFYFFPDLIITFFSGKIIPEAFRILFFLGLAMSFISIANLALLYKLSIGQTKGSVYLLGFVLIEIILLFYFSQDLIQFSLAFVVSSAALLWGSIFFLRD